MPFFIRKKSKNLTNLTRPSGNEGDGGGARPKPRNKDFKPRPANRKKAFGGKRKKSFDKGSRDTEKRSKFDDDEEIESSSDEDDQQILENGTGPDDLSPSKRSDESQNEFFSAEEELEETAQEKKLRLAKVYLEEIEKQERSKRDDEEYDTELVASRLKDDVLETEGRLRKEVAELVEPDLENITILTCPKYLKRSVTCLCITEDDKWIFSGSKDGHLIKWSVGGKKKVGMVKRKEVLSSRKKKKGKKLKTEGSDPNCCHTSAIMAIAVSSDGKFLASGDADRQIVIWNPETMKKIHIFSGHRGAIRGLTFRKKTHTLYSCSDDKSVRIWSLDEMGYVETLFGHQDAVTCIDALCRERCVTGGGRDNSIRIWKIVEESQLVYNGHYNGNIDSVKLINEENFLSCGDDGLLSTWNVNRKKPLVTIENAHGSIKTNSTDQDYQEPRWITSLAAWTNTDLVVSGSSDGFIRFWKCGERFKSLSEVFNVPLQGWVNVMYFSSATDLGSVGRRKFLVVGVGKEHRLGRWFGDIKEAKNGIVIIPLRPRSANTFDDNDNETDKISEDTEDLMTDDED